MKEERIEIRADEGFVEKVDYLKRINGFQNRSETIRKTVEKEYRKETIESDKERVRERIEDAKERCIKEFLYSKGWDGKDMNMACGIMSGHKVVVEHDNGIVICKIEKEKEDGR